MKKTRIKAYVLLAFLLLPFVASTLIQPVKANSNNIWEAPWLDYQRNVDPDGTHHPIANLSTTTTLTDDTGMFTTKIALVVPVYDYEPYDVYDLVEFRTMLYFDSLAEGNLVPAFTDQVIFVVEKDTDGSNLNTQFIEWHKPSEAKGWSQGKGLQQNSPTTSTENERSSWAFKALAFGVGLFLEDITVATGLIGVAQAFLLGGPVNDLIDADYEDIEADSYWGSGIGDHPSPSRQYCFNVVNWYQNETANPSSFYGLKIWAKVSLDPLYNPYDVLDIWMGPIYLRIHHSHALSISATSGGITEPYPGTYHYKEGTSVTVKANAYSGYTFNYWLLDGARNYDNPIGVTMDSDHTLEAHFREVNIVTILNTLGFTNIQESTVETFVPSTYTVKLYAEFAGQHAQNELSWYKVGTTQYNLIFSGPEGNLGYVDPPIVKSTTINGQFGLSFLTSEARYFTETSKNPDGIKHAMIYRNLDNPDMYLIGFENQLGGGDQDYNDMVISLELGSGSGGCPILSVFDGSDYVSEGLLDIHNPDGTDLIYTHTLITEPAWTKGTYQLRLTEHSQTHSYIDQVKLFATLEDGTTIQLPLISAVHSEAGNVISQLLRSDDVKTDTSANQTIDLRFAALNSEAEVVSFIFQIEGNNMVFKEP